MNGIYLYFVNKHLSCWSLLGLNFLSNKKILYRSKFKAFADDKTHVTENFNFVSGKIENTGRNGENAG